MSLHVPMSQFLQALRQGPKRIRNKFVCIIFTSTFNHLHQYDCLIPFRNNWMRRVGYHFDDSHRKYKIKGGKPNFRYSSIHPTPFIHCICQLRQLYNKQSLKPIPYPTKYNIITIYARTLGSTNLRARFLLLTSTYTYDTYVDVWVSPHVRTANPRVRSAKTTMATPPNQTVIP